MNNTDKQNILKMRDAGNSYSEIADTLGLSVGSIKSFFARLRVNSPTHRCLHCRTEIDKKTKTKPIKFCSNMCRYKWWEMNSGYKKQCPCCGEEFRAAHKTQKYCSHACYINYRYKKVGDNDE